MKSAKTVKSLGKRESQGSVLVKWRLLGSPKSPLPWPWKSSPRLTQSLRSSTSPHVPVIEEPHHSTRTSLWNQGWQWGCSMWELWGETDDRWSLGLSQSLALIGSFAATCSLHCFGRLFSGSVGGPLPSSLAPLGPGSGSGPQAWGWVDSYFLWVAM